MFKNRFDAAEQLVPYLQQYAHNPDAIVLAIPRGGLELGSVLAKQLKLPLDIILSKKIGAPFNPEAAIGAVSLKDVFIAEPFKSMPNLQPYIEQQIPLLRAKLHERAERYRKGMPPLDVHNKIVIIVDDGVATGNTLLATIALLKEQKPKKIIVALPVSPKDTLEKIKKESDEVICLLVPEVFYAVGQWYAMFNQVDDEEAIKLLHEANE